MATPEDIISASEDLLPDNNLKEISAEDLRAVFSVVADAISSEAITRSTVTAPLTNPLPIP